ncbi:FMN-binding glutamate synthase family protein [Bacillaceae bacterium]
MFKFLSNLTRSIANEIVDKAIERMARDQYTENLAEMLPVAKKVNPINLMELVMRTKLGQPPPRPLGSHRRYSPWDQFLFNPVHLYRFPTPEDVSITTAVTIGKRARKPLTISIPIMIAGMSFGGALSKKAKIALAKGASMIGTATNTGEAGLMREEREAAHLLIGQYNRGGWLNTPDKYKQLDAIEIQLGQGAQGSSPQRTAAKNLGPEFREVFDIPEGEDALIHSRLPGIDTKEQFIVLVRRLREETGVPVGLKIAATHFLENELQIALEAGVDFITVDGAEGGTHAAAPTLEDDLGLPTLFAVTRAAKFLAKKRAARDVSLIATGGLITPGDCLKALALGADAVYIGTAAVMALIGDQVTKVMPFEPPTALVIYHGKMTDELDVERSAKNLFNFLQATVREMELVCYSLGKTSLSEISKRDLCTLDPFLSRATGVELAYVSHEEQTEFFRPFANLPSLTVPLPNAVSNPLTEEHPPH